MEKQSIIEIYRAADKKEQRRITGAALDFLNERGHPVTRQALKYWRDNNTTRSPLSPLYLKAYEFATGVVRGNLTITQVAQIFNVTSNVLNQ